MARGLHAYIDELQVQLNAAGQASSRITCCYPERSTATSHAAPDRNPFPTGSANSSNSSSNKDGPRP
ncbi:hypothetical protein EMGBS6_01500 [Opitutia bacterium]|nr:hypothetical protein EMGBS6_01500 [Opitutae bacterium]